MTFDLDLAPHGGLEEPRTLSESERLDWLQVIRSENVGPITFFELLCFFSTFHQSPFTP